MENVVYTFSFPDRKMASAELQKGLDVKGPLRMGRVVVYAADVAMFQAYQTGLASGDTLHIDFSDIDGRIWRAMEI